MRKPTKAPRSRAVSTQAAIGNIERAVAALEHVTPALRHISQVDDAQVDRLYRLADRLLMERRTVWLTAQTCGDFLAGIYVKRKAEIMKRMPAVVTARSPQMIKRETKRSRVGR